MMRWELLQDGMVQMIKCVNGHRNDDNESAPEGNVQETTIDDARLLRIGIVKDVTGRLFV